MMSIPESAATPSPSRIETAEDAERLCTSLLGTAAELIAVLDRETDLLRAGRPQEIVALHAHKSALSAALARDMGALRSHADFIRMAAPSRLEELRRQHNDLQRSLQANHDALAAMKSVSESLLRVIAAKAGERRAGPETYGADAVRPETRACAPAAISVDRRL